MKASIKKYRLRKTLAFIAALSIMGSFSQTIGATTLSYNIISAAAEGNDNADNTQKTTAGDKNEDNKDDKKNGNTGASGNGGEDGNTQDESSNGKYNKINVVISNQLDFEQPVECKVMVFDANGTDVLEKDGKSKVVSIEGKIGAEVSVETDYIANGTYTVRIEAEGFLPFEQDISDFLNMVCTVNVTLGFQNGYTYTYEQKTDKNGTPMVNPDGSPIYVERKSEDHPGVLMYGDVDGKLEKDSMGRGVGKIDMGDATILAEAIDCYVKLDEVQKELAEKEKEHEKSSNKNEKANIQKEIDSLTAEKKSLEEKKVKYEDLYLDLNRDGVINLADMGFFTKGYLDNNNWETYANLEKEISSKYTIYKLLSDESNKAKPSEGTKQVEGSATLEDLIKGIETGGTADSESGEEGNNVQKEKPKMKLQATDEEGNVTPISEDHPVGIELPVLGGDVKGYSVEANAASGYIEYTDESTGDVIKVPFSEDKSAITAAESHITATVDSNGNISVNLGNQTAVKRIAIKITSVKNTTLAEIAEVKLLNGLESKLGEPAIDYPTDVTVAQDLKKENKYAQIDISWKPVVNGPGGYEYEVSTSPSTKAGGSFSSIVTKGTLSADSLNAYMKDGRITVSLFSEHGNFKLIKTNTTYYVHVRSAGEGSSSVWSSTSTVSTIATGAPDKPDYVSAKGGTKSIEVSWTSDNTNAAQYYKVYYAKASDIEANGDAAYQEIEVGKVTKYTIVGLEDKVEYKVYVKAFNTYGEDKKTGESPKSDIKSAATIVTVPVEMHKYGAINIDNEGQIGSEHIVNVTRKQDGITIGNDKDDENKENGILSTWAVVDGNQDSYYTLKGVTPEPHTNGGYQNANGNRRIFFEFDKEYEFGSIAITYPYANTSIQYVNICTVDENGRETRVVNTQYGCIERKDKNGNKYYIVNFPKGIKAKRLSVGLDNCGHNGNHLAFSEIAFYERGELKDEIMGLYDESDVFRLTLKNNVTQDKINELREKLNTVDEKTGELHPDFDYLTTELNTAEKILKDAKSIAQPVTVHGQLTSNINKGGKAVNYNGLNAWQPLGVTAGAGTEITVYVGSKNSVNPHQSSIGQNTSLKLVCTQYNSESNYVVLNSSNNQYLKIGANTITIPDSNLGDAEGGGSLYIVNDAEVNANDSYSVRVAGGTQIPVLDLYRVNDRNKRIEKAKEYITALDKHVANMEAEHASVHASSTNSQINRKYDEKTCIAGATEILCTQMMYSLPAPQILAGIGEGELDERAEKLVTSLDAMENMLTLFYQHKGLMANDGSAGSADINKVSNQHLNIRYQRMFTGAFMYAAVNHIGIQWGSASGMVNCPGVTTDENGKYVSGDYFGWGIAHEIGHCLNDANYCVNEITNNYFSLLASSRDNETNSRLDYDRIFKRVTSNVKGRADQGLQLGMYWQLHLAYDNDYNYKTYKTRDEVLNNLFYARVDTYSRNSASANPPLNLTNGDTDQKLMRLACAAAEKNVLEFFESWGMTPDSITKSYASNFPKETRAIMYANEKSRLYVKNKENGESSLKCELVESQDENGNTITNIVRTTEVIDNVELKVGEQKEANKVNLKINVSKEKIASEDILGYEIIRCTISNGNVKESIVGFTKEPEYVDTVTAYNNRTVSYKVAVVDHYLNRSAASETEWVKIKHDGSLDKSNWSVTTNGLTAESIIKKPDEDSQLPCDATVYDPAVEVIDNNHNTVYEPTVTSDAAEIILDFHQSLEVTGLKYTIGSGKNPIGSYEIYVKNGDDWQNVAEGEFKGTDTAETVYFTATGQSYVGTFETTSVMIKILNQNDNTISIAELDVLGVTGDNVDFRQAEGEEEVKVTFGTLEEDYHFGQDAEDFIPAGSLVFLGSYKGNPSYNVVLLYDENGNIVGGTGYDDSGRANEICMADLKPDAPIGDVGNGTWIYWVERQNVETMHWPEKVRVELYRVNDAIYNTGQRIVSDSLFVKLDTKDKLSSISLDGGKIPDTESEEETTTTTSTETTTQSGEETTTTTSTETTIKSEEETNKKSEEETTEDSDND
ncbi:MAG: M60 family metallopeptidase [Ruminococcus sp.]|nr:M60 family metallopeptidase [Ruminococcus sp.]